MSTGFVIGNGLSRQCIDLTKLQGTTYGCNALYREFSPDVLVAVDDQISQHIQRIGYANNKKFYTRKVYGGTGALELQTQYKNWASGPNAVQLAVHDRHDKIILIGFDFGNTTKTFNNMYAGTQFYEQAGSSSVYSSKWENQIRRIFNSHDRIKFTFVTGRTTNIIDFDKLDNVLVINTRTFCNEYLK